MIQRVFFFPFPFLSFFSFFQQDLFAKAQKRTDTAEDKGEVSIDSLKDGI